MVHGYFKLLLEVPGLRLLVLVFSGILTYMFSCMSIRLSIVTELTSVRYFEVDKKNCVDQGER